MSVRPRTAALVATIAVAVVVGAIVLVGRASTPDPAPGGADGATRSASGAAPAAPPGAAQTRPGQAGPTGKPGSTGQPTPTRQPSPTGPLGEAASPSSGAAPGEQPKAEKKKRSLLDVAPDGTESANGRIVGSFPNALRPGPQGRVVSSSVAPSGRRVQVSLVVRDHSAARQVLRRYHLRLAVHGFTELPIRSVPGSTAAVFRNGPESVVVTVTPGRQPSYSVVASLMAG